MRIERGTGTGRVAGRRIAGSDAAHRSSGENSREERQILSRALVAPVPQDKANFDTGSDAGDYGPYVAQLIAGRFKTGRGERKLRPSEVRDAYEEAMDRVEPLQPGHFVSEVY
jgi:hypothetical protein